jgi:hypothetical protein
MLKRFYNNRLHKVINSVAKKSFSLIIISIVCLVYLVVGDCHNRSLRVIKPLAQKVLNDRGVYHRDYKPIFHP